MKLWVRILYFALATFLLSLAVITTQSSHNKDHTFLLIFLPVLAGISLFYLLPAVRGRLALEGSRLRTFSADRSEIKGTRRMHTQYTQWTSVYLKDGRSFNVPYWFRGADDLRQWLIGVPDLDHVDAAEITQQLERISLPGESGEDARIRLQQAKKLVISVAVVAGASAIAVVTRYAQAYAIAALLLLLTPAAGISLLLRNPLLYTLFKRKPDPRVSVDLLILYPGFFFLLFFRADQDAPQFLNLSPLFQVGLLIVLLYVGLLARHAWRTPSRWASLLSLLVCGIFYASAVARTVDTLPDHSAAAPYQSTVVNLHEVHGKHTSYYVTLAPWGPHNTSSDAEVSLAFYQQTQIGDILCLKEHSGYLHAPWYTLSRCFIPSGNSEP